jgi:hypothetical protein|tara:strand:- start:1066 stop:1239 length:174 start_codon:yes stop_codon:yes gene_type:complete
VPSKIGDNTMIDAHLARELIILKAKDLGLEEEALEELDALVCTTIGVEEPEPLILEL